MFDCLAFQESTTNDGLLPVAPAGGEPHGYRVVGDTVRMKGKGRILAGIYITAAIANWIAGRVGSQDDPDLRHPQTQTFIRDQAGAIVNPMQINYPYEKNALLQCDQDHGANAQVASLIYLVSTGTPMLFFGERPNNIPRNAIWITATGVTAAIANTWVEDLVTFTYTFNVDKKYDVYGLRAFSTTGFGFRIHPQEDPTLWRAGWMMGDTNILLQTIYSQTPMFTFSGENPPTFDKLCSSTDSTASRYEMLIVEK